MQGVEPELVPVEDFGLTKTKSMSSQSRIVNSFGYGLRRDILDRQRNHFMPVADELISLINNNS